LLAQPAALLASVNRFFFVFSDIKFLKLEPQKPQSPGSPRALFLMRRGAAEADEKDSFYS
jgi:hypothetical protein